MNDGKTLVVVPWHDEQQLDLFLEAWGIHDKDKGIPDTLLLQQDKDREGCARTKNRGIRAAIEAKADYIVVLDDDCYPLHQNPTALGSFIAAHRAALQPQQIPMFEAVTDPPSRGTPYFTRTLEMPVAASMGFWTGVGDYDAPGQLIHGATKPMSFNRTPIHGRYFPLCGMNIAFSTSWWPWCQFIAGVGRMDDIWMGYLWQRHAYAKGYCFNLCGPTVRHARQSNVWANLAAEAPYLEQNEQAWRRVASSPPAEIDNYPALRCRLTAAYP